MSILPRTRRSVWLTAAAVWLAGVCAAWSMVPVRPRAEYELENTGFYQVLSDNRTLVYLESIWCDNYVLLDTATGHRRNVRRLWDGAEGELSPDGRWLAVVKPFDDRSFRLMAIDTQTGQPHATWQFESDDVGWSLNAGTWWGSQFVQCDHIRNEPRIQFFDIATGGSPRVLTNAWGLVSHSLDGRYLFFGRPGMPMDVAETTAWDGRREHALGKVRHDWPGTPVVWNGNYVVRKACPPEEKGHRLDSILRCYEVGTGRELWVSPEIWPWRMSPDARTVVGAEEHQSGGARIVVRSLPDGNVIREVPCPAGVSHVMDFSPDATLALAFRDETADHSWMPQWAHDQLQRHLDFPSPVSVVLIDTVSGRSWRIASRPWEAKFFPDGRSFYVVDAYGKIGIWDVPPRKPLVWLAAGAAAWAVPLALLARWRVRRLNQIGRA